MTTKEQLKARQGQLEEWHCMYENDPRTTFGAVVLRYVFFVLGTITGAGVIRWLIARYHEISPLDGGITMKYW